MNSEGDFTIVAVERSRVASGRRSEGCVHGHLKSKPERFTVFEGITKSTITTSRWGLDGRVIGSHLI